MKTLIAFLLLSAVGTPVFAEEPSSPAFSVSTRPARPEDIDAGPAMPALADPVLLPVFDLPGDGALWVRGTSYKARFDAQGLEFTPFLGSEAPFNYPVRFTLESASIGEMRLAFDGAAEPEREGNRVVYRRGALDEVFLVRAGFVEQLFVVRERGAPGALEIVVRAETGLDAAGRFDGARFGNDLGGVDYSRAILIDARRRTIPAATSVRDGTLVIRVDAVDLATAEFPLVVDPVITTWTVNGPNQTTAMSNPDTSYDATTDSWLCTYEETFSQSDHDVMTRRFNASGGAIDAAYVDFTGNSWTRPRVSNCNARDQFMVVAEVNLGSSFPRISVRTRSALNTAMGAQIDLATGNASDRPSSPDIGGDAFPLGSPAYCVVWKRAAAGTQTVLSRLVTPLGTLLPVRQVSSNGDVWTDARVRLSKSNGHYAYGNQRWNVAWDGMLPNVPGVRGVTVAQIDLAGQRVGAPFSAWGESVYSVSSLLHQYGPRKFALVEKDYHGGMYVVEYTPLSDASNSFSTRFVGTVTLAAHSGAAIETDGSRYLVAHAQQSGIGVDEHVYFSVHASGGSGSTAVLTPVAASVFCSELTPSIATKCVSGGSGQEALCTLKQSSGTAGPFFFPEAILASRVY